MPEQDFHQDREPTRSIRYEHGKAPVSWDQARERPTEDPGPPPAPRWTAPLWLAWVVSLAVIIAAVATVGIVLRESGALPSSVPLIGRDPGRELCEAVAGGGSPTGSNTPGEMTEESYREARDVARSIDNDSLRSGTVKLIDMAWQDRNGKLGLEALGAVGAAYAEMTTGCADLGVSLPALAELPSAN